MRAGHGIRADHDLSPPAHRDGGSPSGTDWPGPPVDQPGARSRPATTQNRAEPRARSWPPEGRSQAIAPADRSVQIRRPCAEHRPDSRCKAPSPPRVAVIWVAHRRHREIGENCGFVISIDTHLVVRKLGESSTASGFASPIPQGDRVDGCARGRYRDDRRARRQALHPRGASASGRDESDRQGQQGQVYTDRSAPRSANTGCQSRVRRFGFVRVVRPERYRHNWTSSMRKKRSLEGNALATDLEPMSQ